MEDVLEVYTRAYDPRRPQVYLDETSVQLVGETRTLLPVAPGEPARYDCEYERHGVSAVFMLNEPLRGWREVVVGDQRTALDWAYLVKHLVDVHYPDAEQPLTIEHGGLHASALRFAGIYGRARRAINWSMATSPAMSLSPTGCRRP